MLLNMDNNIKSEIFVDINWFHPAIIRALAAIAFMPIFWNSFARLEYFTKILTAVFGCGNRYIAVYVLACMIFSVSSFRDYLFLLAMGSHSPSKFLSSHLFLKPLGFALVGIGAAFVLSSFWRLGIAGTYMGDYFGILKKSRIESFPFNVVSDPMYTGATMIFCGQSLLSKSWIGLACTIWAFVCYKIAVYFESPFTSMIYERAAAADKEKRK